MEKKLIINNSKIILKEAKEEDRDNILNFLNFLFPHKRYDENWFKWIRSEKDYKRDYYIAFDEDKIIGIYGMAPVKVKLKEDILWASHSCNIGLEPRYWGSNLFEELSFFAFENDKKKGRAFVFCSPRRPLAIKAHKRIGWIHIRDLIFLDRIEKGERFENFFERVNLFQEKHDIILEKFYEDKDFCVLKDSRYLNWRYKPNFYSFYTDNRNSVVVLKEYTEKNNEVKYFHIIEGIFSDVKEIKNSLMFIDSIKKSDYKVNTWALENSKYLEILKNNLFLFNGNKCPFMVYVYYDDLKNRFYDLKNPYFSLGDDEAF